MNLAKMGFWLCTGWVLIGKGMEDKYRYGGKREGKGEKSKVEMYGG